MAKEIRVVNGVLRLTEMTDLRLRSPDGSRFDLGVGDTGDLTTVDSLSQVPTPIYNETIADTGIVGSGTPVTLPAAGVWTPNELKIYLNESELTLNDDFTPPTGSAPYTDVLFTFGLVNGDTLHFIIE